MGNLPSRSLRLPLSFPRMLSADARVWKASPCPKVSLSKTHGVNIRRTADGKTRKVVVK